MKAYVIKRDDGLYWCGFDGFIGEHIYSTEIFNGLNTTTPTYKHCREEVKEYNLQNCKVVPVTIIEGNLEEHDKQRNQKIIELEEHIKDMEQEQIAEMKEHEEFAKQAKSKIAELETRIDELEDKDWYEKTIKQLENQNDRLIKERDTLEKALELVCDEYNETDADNQVVVNFFISKAQEELNNDR